MSWQAAAWLMLGGSTVLLFLGLPVAFAFIAINIAGAAIWLIVTDPVTVANAVSEGAVMPIMEAIGAVILNALKGLFRYL